jgi:ribulose-phosphate 3-epimerase
MNNTIKVSPSLLSADFGALQAEIDRAEPYVDGFHFDVMDGHFVPNLTAGAPVLAKLRSKKPFDAHLMVTDPDSLLDDFAKAGAAAVSVHFETGFHLHRTLQKIRSLGMRAGVALNPTTTFEAAYEAIGYADFVLIMSINPGFSGQAFIPETLQKVRRIRAAFPEKEIQLDGGANDKTIGAILEAGVNWIVSGAYFWSSEDLRAAADVLRGASRE